jgi:hypothetical protein
MILQPGIAARDVDTARGLRRAAARGMTLTNSSAAAGRRLLGIRPGPSNTRDGEFGA